MDQNILNGDAIKQFKLPPTPYALSAIQKEINKPDFEIGKVANLIAQDAGLSALMLRSVNSSFFALRQEVTSIHHAINLLGIKNTVNIVSGLIMRQGLSGDNQAIPPKFWDSPSNIALILAAVTKKLTKYPTDEAYMLGLFHNVGHVLLMSKFEQYGEFLELNFNPDGQSLVDQEIEHFGIDHASLGFVLARSWGLNEGVSNIIRYHHRVLEVFETGLLTDEKEVTLLCLLKIAENVDKRFWGETIDYEWNEMGPTILDYIGLSELDFDELAADMAEKLISGY